jgi:tetratricopeptide (TPR) repeat protein
MSAATALMADQPAEGIAQLEAVLADYDALCAEWERCLAAISADPALASLAAEINGQMKDQLRHMHASMHVTLGMGQYRRGDAAACAAHLQRYLALSEDKRDPQRTIAMWAVGRMALDKSNLDEARRWIDLLAVEARSWTDAAPWTGIVPVGEEERAIKGAWRQVSACQALRADLALAEGDREGYLRYSGEALDSALRCGANDDARTLWWARMTYELIWDATGERLDRAEAEVRSSAPDPVRDQPDFKRRLLQARAQVWIERGNSDKALQMLQDALVTLDASNWSGWTLHLDVADLHSARGEHADALREAETALALAQQSQSSVLERQCAERLLGYRLATGDPAQAERALAEVDGDLPILADSSRPADRASLLTLRAQLLQVLKRYDAALEVIDEIAALPGDALAQASVTPAFLAALRATVLRMAGRLGEAVAVLASAIEKTEAVATTDDAWRDHERQLQTLYMGAALNGAELGWVQPALDWCERGQIRNWRRALAFRGISGSWQADGLAGLRTRLNAHQAALVMFVLGPRRTAALVVPADGASPWSRILPVGEADWSDRFTNLDYGEAEWNPRFTANLKQFSEWLGPLLQDATCGARRLYVVPDGMLALVPYAALRLGPDTPLVERCACALLPAASFTWADSNPNPERLRLLSAGAGKSGSTNGASHDFGEMAAEIAERWQSGDSVTMLGVRLEPWLEQAPTFNVLHLSCHGNVQRGRLDPLAASTLDFDNNERLSARLLSARWSGRADFDLVFLNACVTAGFSFRRGVGGGGFWRSLIEVGARAVVGTLSYVDPGHAQQLALAFYRHWQGGTGPAEALRLSQLELYRSGVPEAGWATHVIVGAGALN